MVHVGRGDNSPELSNSINQARLTRSRSFVPCYNKSHFDAQNLKLINSAQGPEPDIIYLVRLVRSKSSVPCYNKANSDAQSPKLINCGTVVAHGTTA